MKKFDVGIIGAGVAGLFATVRCGENYKDSSVILFELGRPHGKRRRALEGYFGSFPGSDGKIYPNDTHQILSAVDGRKVKGVNTYINNWFSQVNQMKVIKDKLPSVATQKKIQAANFEIKLNDYIQWKPESIHKLSKILAETIENSPNITCSFDNEVLTITKQKSGFILSTSAEGDIFCKKILICVGRSGWRWVNNIYHELGLVINDDIASYGITVELTAGQLKEFNKSHCLLQRKDIEVGPFCWNGTIIPEDHADLVISAFRSNEDRWKSDKVSFSIIGYRKVENNDGVFQTDRLAKLAFLLFNDRVGKEKIKTMFNESCPLSFLPEYSWLDDTINELSTFIPNIKNKGSFHAPTILPLASEVRLAPNLESEIDDFFIAGESAGFRGILAAAISGIIAIDGALS